MAHRKTDFPNPPAGTRKSSEIRAAWGGTPPQREALGLIPFTFWNGVAIPGGINPAMKNALLHLDAVLKARHYHPKEGQVWCWNRRQTKYGKVWSLHSWAIAVDINSLENPYSRRFRTTFTPDIIRDIYSVRHPNGAVVWQWGGKWSVADGMHFQLSLTPEEARTMPAPAAPATEPAPAAPAPAPTPTPSPESFVDGARLAGLEVKVEDLTRRHTILNDQFTVLTTVLQGVDPWTFAAWMHKGATGETPDVDAVDAIAERLEKRETVESIMQSLQGRT